MTFQFEPDVLQDFLTEAGELLDQLDADLVSLESTPDDPDLTNKTFRALHTIKGSASFLALTELVEVAHASEDALNAARKGEATIDRRFMDLILEAVDVVRAQMEQLETGEPLDKAPSDLVESLRQIGAGGAPSPANDGADAPSEEEVPAGAEALAAGEVALRLPESKAELLSFMADDLSESLDRLLEPVKAIAKPDEREDAAREIMDLCEGLARSTEFFECAQMMELVALLSLVGEKEEEIREQDFPQLTPRLLAIVELLRLQAQSLERSRIRLFHVDDLTASVADLILGNDLAQEALLADDADWSAALKIDNVDLEQRAASSDPTTDGPTTATVAVADSADADGATPAVTNTVELSPEKATSDSQASQRSHKNIEQTIRVEVDRLESLQNLVGELVLQKNRVTALSRAVTVIDGVNQEMRESINQSSSDLDRVTGDIQVAVMRTRMQPLDKLFGRYPRLIRDLSRKTNKEINLVIEGGETEVDKSVLEALGDPLVHLLRNAADHGVETPDKRTAAGKTATGTIWLSASHEGGNVRVRIRDDGAGLDRERIKRKAIQQGVATEEEIAALTDKQINRFIFAAGFSTADEVSDLSGRGVGMDVVRNSIEGVKGHIDVVSEPGDGTTVSILIPLTVAIMPAMMVKVGNETYAVPLSNVLQIVRPEDEQVSSVQGESVVRLRGTVIPLVSMSGLFGTHLENKDDERFALVVTHNDHQVGLLVSQLLGQHEVVIKPLDDKYKGVGPVSGATVRDDGGVSLIVDVAKVVLQASGARVAAAAA